MNVVVCGHVDHGKSTLIGRLLYDSGQLSDGKVSEMQRLVEEYKKRFEFAYFMDAFEEELMEERTIDTTRVVFKGKDRLYTIVDVPGHKEFIKNMLTGACNADVAILVVDASKGIEEQTGRHIFLLDMLGVRKVIVAINKMDLVNYEPLPFEETKLEVSKLLDGFNWIRYVPISALEGSNVCKKDNTDWWQGESLIDLLDTVQIEEKSRRLILQVQDRYKDWTLLNKISGTWLQDSLSFMYFKPSNTESIVSYYEGKGSSLAIRSGIDIPRGDVAGDDIRVSNSFKSEIVVLEGSIKEGDTLTLKCGTKEVVCKISSIESKLSSETGVEFPNNRVISKEEAGIITLSTEPLVVERFEDLPELGRFTLYKKGKIVGLGIVLEVYAD